MTISKVVNMFGADGRMRLENWAIYAAFAPLDERTSLVKIGLSIEPLERIYAVHCGSPFPVKKAMWMYVGRKETAARVERSIHRKMAEKRTRGEWFKVETDSAEDKALFHESVRYALSRFARMRPAWNKVDIATVIEAKSIRWRDQRA